MAAKPLDQSVAEAIVTDWRVTELSQQAIAEKHSVSKGVVNKLCKGVERDGHAIVTAGIQYRQALAAHDDRIVTAIEHEVDERTKHIQFFTHAAITNVKEAMDSPCEGQMDYQRRADTILKAKETVIGKTPETAIQINNSSAPTITQEEFRNTARALLTEV